MIVTLRLVCKDFRNEIHGGTPRMAKSEKD